MMARTLFGKSPTQRNRSIAPRCFPTVSKGWRSRRAEVLGIAVLLLGGCTVGPKYVRPTADVPADYKEVGAWKSAQPSDAIAKGKWWEVYGDPQLNALEEQVSVSNETLKAAQAQFLEARAAIRTVRAAYFPTVTANPSAAGTRDSQNQALFGTTTPINYATYELPPIDASWEPDVWGRVRRTVEAARSEAQATAADLANTELSLHAELALDYFQLRGLDSQQQLLDSTVTSYERALQLTDSRYKGGVASGVDVAQAQTQLETTRAQAADVAVDRTAFEHAIAVLIGKPPYQFSQQPLPLSTPPPAIPPGLPSELLERRPDIGAGQLRQIGGYLPADHADGVSGGRGQPLGPACP